MLHNVHFGYKTQALDLKERREVLHYAALHGRSDVVSVALEQEAASSEARCWVYVALLGLTSTGSGLLIPVIK